MANERLYQFPSKATPVPADIIYVGDSAAAFDEVNCTIAQVIGAYPNLLGIGNLTLSANTFIYSNNSAVLTAGSITALAVTLLADSTVATMQATLGYASAPVASLFAGWDANKNLTANNLISGYATTATAGGTTVLTVGSAQSQYFTGTLSQTITMPVTNTLALGMYWTFVNLSSGTLTIQSSGGNTITTVGANASTYVTCILTSGTSAASWSAETPVAGSGVVNSGTINNLAYYAANGSTVSSLATANNGVLVTSAAGVPSISSTLPASLVVPSPKISTGLYDSNNNLMLAFNPIGSAVNYIQISNASTGNAVGWQAIGSDTNVIWSLSGKGTGYVQIQGTSGADNAGTGFVGQVMTSNIASGTPVSFSNNTPKDLTSLNLTAGDWDVYGNIIFTGSIAITGFQIWLSLTSATAPDTSLLNGSNGITATYCGANAPSFRVNVSTTTTVYLSGQISFASGTGSGQGTIYARRRR